MAIQAPNARSIFEQALEFELESGRTAFLDQACGDDTVLRTQVERLLAAHFAAGSFLASPVSKYVATAELTQLSEQPGTVIGPYKLLEQIGEGGMGIVYMADQQTPVRRRVALKIIKPGMDTRKVIARFEAERQALALMDHPNIARVLDAGATELGRPYFVMELVRGIPITAYCDGKNLPVRERLELFIQVCHAVQHAHQKGIIHRDLKPTNVLVTMQDGQAMPKIIDFGVAKATGQQLTEKTLFTAFAQVVGTPLYMSPEQAEMSSVDVDTRSDVYSLGVVLYELLTGTTPFTKERLHSAAFDEIRRIIREEEPPRPSTRISTLASDRLSTVAEHRRTDVRRLQHSVRGELDWIVMKCLEKDRNRRYETPSSLARDVERYLHDEPVQACPPSFVYRFRKYIRRNKVGVLAGSSVVIALLAGLTVATAGFLQARRQAQISTAQAAKATAISGLLQAALQSANPDQAKGPDYTVRQLLDDFSGGLADQLVGQPDVEADIRATIGNAYRQLGLFDLAAPQFETALALRRRIDGSEDGDYAKILVDYAQNLAEQMHLVDAERTAREAIDIYRRAGISGRPLVKALWILQLQLAFRADFANEMSVVQAAYAEEQGVVEEAIAIAQADGAEYPELANMLHRHAPLMSKLGDQAEAEQWARRAVDMHRRLHGNEHPETAHGLADLGRVLRDRKKYREAETAFREALEIFRHYYGDGFQAVQGVRRELNNVLGILGDAADSRAHDDSTEEAPKESEPDSASAAANRSIRLAQGALERELRDVLASIEKDIHRTTDNKSLRLTQAATNRQLAEIDVKQGKLKEAIEYLRKAVTIANRLVEEDPKNASFAEERLRAQMCLAETLARSEQMDEFLAAFAAMLTANDEAFANFPNQFSSWLSTRPLTSDTCIRCISALRDYAKRDPENAEKAHLLFDRAIEQLNKFCAVSHVGIALETADLYIHMVPVLAADPEWNRHVPDIEHRLSALLRAILERFPTSAASETVGHKWRLWAFALPPSDEYQDSIERALKKAITIFEKVTVDTPDNDEAWHFLADTHRHWGKSLGREGRADEAEQAFRRAIKLHEQRVAKFPNYSGNEGERAASNLDFAVFLTKAGRLEEALKQYRQGCDILERSIQSQPSASNYNYLAWVLLATPIEQFRDPNRAVELAEKAIKLSPQDGNIWNTLGVAQYRAGDARAAIETLKKSMGLSDGGDALDWFFLAMAHWQLGHKDEARTWYDRGTDWVDKKGSFNEGLLRFRAEAANMLGIAETQPSAELDPSADAPANAGKSEPESPTTTDD